MIIHQYVAKAIQDDAPRAGERDRLLLEARRARTACSKRMVPAVPMRRMARLLLRRAPAWSPRHFVILRCGRSSSAFGGPTADSTEASSRA